MAQRGFSSVLLIAIIVLLAGMTTFALRFVAGAQGSASVQAQAMRAQRAAEAAIEWQRYSLFKAVQPGGCALTTNLSIPSVLGAMPVTVTCNRTPTPASVHSEGGTNFYTYTFTARACWPAGGGGGCPNAALPSNYVERQITAQAACRNGPAPAVATCTW